MVSTAELRAVHRMVAVIKARGSIHRWEMLELSKVSIAKYAQLKSYMEWKFADQIKYDKGHEEWSYIYSTPEVKVEVQEQLPEVKT